MTAEQMNALLDYIDARIDQRMAKHSCGPQVAELGKATRLAKEQLIYEFSAGQR